MDQPRVPAGSPEGGQFSSKGGLSGTFVVGVSGLGGSGKWAGGTRGLDEKDFPEIDKQIRSVSKDYGKEMGLYDVARLAGVLPGGKISAVTIEDGMIGVTHALYDKNGTHVGSADRMIFLETRSIHNNSIKIFDQKKGWAAKALNQQVNAAVEQGFKDITLLAAGGPGEKTNGYYTWPRLGFLPRKGGVMDMKVIQQGTRRDARINVPRLMSTKAGRDWWLKHGESHGGRFDLAEGSISRRVLAAYIKEKGY